MRTILSSVTAVPPVVMAKRSNTRRRRGRWRAGKLARSLPGMQVEFVDPSSLPDPFASVEALEDLMTRPSPALVKAFVQLGCQQMQLNTLNYETLLDAREHPERHRNLIVRVWGWSGYFCELSPEYQLHVLARHRYALG
jgi:autonomous glycyl radical cofactor GrcA